MKVGKMVALSIKTNHREDKMTEGKEKEKDTRKRKI